MARILFKAGSEFQSISMTSGEPLLIHGTNITTITYNVQSIFEITDEINSTIEEEVSDIDGHSYMPTDFFFKHRLIRACMVCSIPLPFR